MTNKTNKHISLDLAKRLHALGGLKGIESEYVWARQLGSGEVSLETTERIKRILFLNFEIFPAYDTTELGEFLPSAMTLTRRAVDGQWRYPNMDGESLYAPTEAEARGLMAEYLLKEKLV